MLCIAGVLVASPCFAQNPSTNSAPHDPDRESLLSLPWRQFDQTANSGWHIYNDRKQYLQAAKLIEAYLIRHNELNERERAISNFHAAKEYIALALEYGGDNQAALPHLDQAIVSKESGMSADWNDLVIVTKAFLTGDRTTLLLVKDRIAAMPPGTRKWLKEPYGVEGYLDNLGKPYGSWWPKE